MKKKIFIAIGIAVLCMVAIVFGVLFSTSVKVNAADKALTPSEVFTVNIPEHGTGVKLISEVIEGEAMPYEMRSGYAFIAAYYLQAEVTGPENTSVTYSVAYKDGTAVESDVVSYMSNGSSIFIGFHKKFSQTVVVTAISNANPYAFSTCEIDCYKEYTGSNFIIDFCGSTTYVEDGETYYIDSDYQLSEDYFSVISDSQYFGSYGSGNGGPDSEHWFIYLTTEAIQALGNNGIGYEYYCDVASLYDMFCYSIPLFEYSPDEVLSALSEVNTIFECELIGEWMDENYNLRDESCGHFYIGGFDLSEFISNSGNEEHLVLDNALLSLHSDAGESEFGLNESDCHYDISNISTSEIYDFVIDLSTNDATSGSYMCDNDRWEFSMYIYLTDEARELIESYLDYDLEFSCYFDGVYELDFTTIFNELGNAIAELSIYELINYLSSCSNVFYVTIDYYIQCYEGFPPSGGQFNFYISGWQLN